jgi:5-hydroxyisourate hydrolase
MGRVTTHVLDTARGMAAAGMKVDLYALAPSRALIRSAMTNINGRTDAPMLEGEAFKPGPYELVFAVGAYFRASGVAQASPPFLDEVPIRFTIAEADGHYHVPLLASPWSYTTYRGS